MKTMLVAILVLCLMEVNAAMADTASFADDTAGAPPKGWTATMTGKGNPKWVVEADPTGPSRSKVVKQSGVATYPLLLKDGISLKDGFVEIRFKAIAGAEDRAGGIVWRAKDANNYYVLRANALEDNVVLYKTVDSTRSALDIIGRYRPLRIRAAGSFRRVAFAAR